MNPITYLATTKAYASRHVPQSLRESCVDLHCSRCRVECLALRESWVKTNEVSAKLKTPIAVFCPRCFDSNPANVDGTLVLYPINPTVEQALTAHRVEQN